MKANSLPLRGMTDRRDCRTSAMSLSSHFPLICVSVTGLGSGFTGTRSTEVQLLATHLKRSGVPFLVTREPGGTAIAESIRVLMQFAPQSAGITPETELLLFEASGSQLVREVINPALELGECVIADR